MVDKAIYEQNSTVTFPGRYEVSEGAPCGELTSFYDSYQPLGSSRNNVTCTSNKRGEVLILQTENQGSLCGSLVTQNQQPLKKTSLILGHSGQLLLYPKAREHKKCMVPLRLVDKLQDR